MSGQKYRVHVFDPTGKKRIHSFDTFLHPEEVAKAIREGSPIQMSDTRTVTLFKENVGYLETRMT